MNTSNDKWHPVADINDIPLRGSRRVLLTDHQIALFRTADNKVYALRDSCPHKAGPLSAGIVHDDCVTCPLHNWVISLKSGRALGADKGCTPVFPIKVVDQQVMVKLELYAAAQPVNT